ncbi:hypothetical protein ACWDCB_40325 [Streptomyces sp. NPDC001178]
MRVSEDVLVSDHQYWILGDVPPDTSAFDFRGFDGLVAALDAPGLITSPGSCAVVLTGTSTGDIRLTVEIRDSEPEHVEHDVWEEVGEVSLVRTGAELSVFTDSHEDEEVPDPAFPDFTTAGPGPYRMRVHARGRDEAYRRDPAEDEPIVEEHLIVVWPAPVQPAVCHKTTDQYGARVRAQ